MANCFYMDKMANTLLSLGKYVSNTDTVFPLHLKGDENVSSKTPIGGQRSG